MVEACKQSDHRSSGPRPRRRTPRTWLVAALLVGTVWLLAIAPAMAQTPRAGAAAAGPRDYRSNNFYLHTDLSPDDAQELLKRLEHMLGLIAGYWGRRPSGVIEMYVVDKLSNWPPGTLPAEGVAKVREGAGVTVSQRAVVGNQFISKAVVYSVADRGTPQHEAVHAYCSQTFGSTGPTWYSEGMAEMGQYWREEEKGVLIHPGVLEYLQNSEPKSLVSIVDLTQVTGDSWQNYAWRWGLCHLLANNPNYAPRFRPLGLAMLTGQPATFEQVYGPMAAEISFEYLFFMEHICQGYRADLAAWDWKKKFTPSNTSTRLFTANVQANRGWQPTGLTVESGKTYDYVVTGGESKLEAKGEEITADGLADGKGRLMGIVMKDFKLGKPFPLGVRGALNSSEEGNLYLRVQDDWSSLGDNSGRLTVKLRLQPEPK